MATFRSLILATAALLVLAACSPSSEAGRYVEVQGGGFLFNYRMAEVTAGFNVKTLKKLPNNGLLEASFENPAGGEPLIVRQPASASAEQYSFMSPPITGVVKDKEYEVILRVRDAGGKELQRIEMAFVSEVDGSVMPEKPLTVGPGYTRPDQIAPPTVTFPPQQ